VDLLKQLQCEEMQGYKFSRPLTPEDATKFLEKQQLIPA
jgi:EAL domain-containing protein (putative c-di-GMP-specific phosphodiesterase class I)